MVRVYVASDIPTSYPYKLQKPSTVRYAVRDTAESFIFDSGIGNDDLDNKEVLDMAEGYDADYVIAKDYLHEPRRTTESVAEFIDYYEKSRCTATPMCPVQPDYVQHYEDLKNHSIKGTSITEWFDHYVLGGMSTDEVSTEDQIKWINKFDSVVEDSAYVHALGVGTSMKFIQSFAGTGVLDSVDCSTPEMAGAFGCVFDQRLRREEVRVMSGEGASKRNHALAEFNSWQLQDVWDREEGSMGATDW